MKKFEEIWTIFNTGQYLPLLRLFSSFPHSNNNYLQIQFQQYKLEISVNGELGIRIWGRRMVGADETTEL